jgi:hypothetical protein
VAIQEMTCMIDIKGGGSGTYEGKGTHLGETLLHVGDHTVQDAYDGGGSKGKGKAPRTHLPYRII